MNDIADPQSRSRLRLASRSARNGASAFWTIDGRRGFAFTRWGNSSMTTGTGPAPVAAEGEQGVDGPVPGVEHRRRGVAEVVGEDLAEPVQRLAVGGLLRGEVEAAGRLAHRPQEEGLALASTPGHDTERGSRTRIGDEIGECRPLELPVEHVSRPAQRLHGAPSPALRIQSFTSDKYSYENWEAQVGPEDHHKADRLHR
jgi:hypothetical protein